MTDHGRLKSSRPQTAYDPAESKQRTTINIADFQIPDSQVLLHTITLAVQEVLFNCAIT
jgi:hypothetical protein